MIKNVIVRIKKYFTLFAQGKRANPTESTQSQIQQFASFLANRMEGGDVIELEYENWHPSASSLWGNLPANPCIIYSGDIKRQLPQFFEELREQIPDAGVVILTTPRYGKWDANELESVLRRYNLPVEAVGYASGIPLQGEKDTVVALLRKNGKAKDAASPPLRVLAIIALYNDTDIILPILKHFTRQGIHVYAIDYWSTDGTYELVDELRKSDPFIAGLERFPASPPGMLDWKSLLKRKEEVAQSLSFDWYLHSDPDEIRCSPWKDVSLLEGIQMVDREGYNAIDFTVLNFSPINNLDFPANTDPLHYLEYFDFGRRPGHFRQVRAWKNTGRGVDIASTGGHNIKFEGRRVYPYKFLLRHYPFRSQTQGSRKISESKKRTEQEHKKLGWHRHYRLYAHEHLFYKKEDELIKFDDSFYGNYLIERLSGIGIPKDNQST